MRGNERQNGKIQAGKFSNMFWFIDDLTAINGGKEIEKIYHEIDPIEL